MSDISPPNIWSFEECNNVNTEGVHMKEYKPVGQFYTDANMLCHLFGIKPHPIFKEPHVPNFSDPDGDVVAGFDDQRRAKEPTTITVSKYRLDLNSMKVLFKVLEGCHHIQTLK